MRTSDKDRLSDDLHILLGISMARYDLSEEEVIDTLKQMQYGIESGRYDVFFAAGGVGSGDVDADGDGDPE